MAFDLKMEQHLLQFSGKRKNKLLFGLEKKNNKKLKVIQKLLK